MQLAHYLAPYTAALVSGLLLFVPVSGPARGEALDFATGKALFDRIWTSSPASTDATDGLGPLFNARSCATCHMDGGRGRFQEQGDGSITGSGLVLRLGNGNGEDDPAYGFQLQTGAVQGLQAEGHAVRLESGALAARGLNFGPLHTDTRLSGRLAPDLHGLGLLQGVPDGEISAWADPRDRNQDGISGRVNTVRAQGGEVRLGRFGWKADKASILEQTATALNMDLGLSNPLFPAHAGDCTARQADCLDAPHGDSAAFEGLEASSKMLSLIALYVAGLRPHSASTTPLDHDGQQIFSHTGCGQCHRPTLALGNGGSIAAYTDLLLHDMGDGLADGIRDGDASGREWRTAPLWGLRYATRYLHDGRATTINGAILLHDGEARTTIQRYKALSPVRRRALLDFLAGL